MFSVVRLFCALFLFLLVYPASPILAAPVKLSSVTFIGHENWERAWLPDLQHSGDGKQVVRIPDSKVIDIVLLGDGYLPAEHNTFIYDARIWYKRFLRYVPYYQMRGVFRVRALWTPSPERCSLAQNTALHVGVTQSGGSIGLWNSRDTRAAIFQALDRIGINPTQSGTRLTHTFVGLLLKNQKGSQPSGLTRTLISLDGKRSVRVAMGEHIIHEFSHAYAGLDDEYISTPNSAAHASTPDTLSLWTVSNIGYTRDPTRIPWRHLGPGSEVNPDKESLVGVLWQGGSFCEKGAWHCQARCLMNGYGGGNWNYAKTKRGINLRNFEAFCFWCEEIIVAKTYAKTGLLAPNGEEDGKVLWGVWETRFRASYQSVFRVRERIAARNQENADAHLADAKIYERVGKKDDTVEKDAAARSGGSAEQEQNHEEPAVTPEPVPAKEKTAPH